MCDLSGVYGSRRIFTPVEQPVQSGSDVRLVLFGRFECRETCMEDMRETGVSANSSDPQTQKLRRRELLVALCWNRTYTFTYVLHPASRKRRS